MVGQSAGLMDSAKRLASTLIAIISTRLELLANEVQEERLRLMQMFFFSLFALFCFGMGVLLLTVFITCCSGMTTASLCSAGCVFFSLCWLR